ncbi:MAG: hypothetical protein JNJ50_00780 [Acidobacteria bacterium]|nr:hypothetical protein [Acidobacteriota bacterium]
MGETIGNIVFIVVALVVIAAVGSLILSVVGLVLGLIPLVIKLAIWGGLIYLAWLAIQKFTQKAAS